MADVAVVEHPHEDEEHEMEHPHEDEEHEMEHPHEDEDHGLEHPYEDEDHGEFGSVGGSKNQCSRICGRSEQMLNVQWRSLEKTVRS